METWTILDPFDTILIKNWSEEQIELLIRSFISSGSQPEVAEALSPIRPNTDYYRDEIIREIITEFRKAPSFCNKDIYCWDVINHSNGMKCVTAAAIRRRLYLKFPRHLGSLCKSEFQKAVVSFCNISTIRNKLGVLLFHCPRLINNDSSIANDSPTTSSSPLIKQENVVCPSKLSLYEHTLKVLYDNFYLYTAPLDQQYLTENNRETILFIGNQIFRNADCIVILVDDEMIRRWNGDFGTTLLKSLEWEIKIKVLVIGVTPSSRQLVLDIYNSMQKMPWPIFYEQISLAPSGGLIAIVKKACKLEFKNSFIKYIHRASVIFNGLDRID